MRLVLVSTLLLLAACQQEPSFDERFEAAQKKVGSTARELDGEMVRSDRAAEADQRALEAAGRAGPKPAATPAR